MTNSSICSSFRPASAGGASCIPPTMAWILFSTSTICSRISAMDQRPGSGLKSHCGASKPLRAWRRASRVDMRYPVALDISLGLKSEGIKLRCRSRQARRPVLLQILQQGRIEWRGALGLRHVPAGIQDHALGAGDVFRESLAVRKWNERVLAAPDHQGRSFDRAQLAVHQVLTAQNRIEEAFDGVTVVLAQVQH